MAIDNNQLLGQSLGTCTLQRLLGRGGMGAVYIAQQSRPRRTVAVKVILPELSLQTEAYKEFLTRFRREADSIAALDHVNIMPVYEYGEQERLAYLVMPYVTGGTLRDTLAQRGKLPLREAIPIIDQIAAALDYAHGHGIIHRDLKPGNILFHADGRLLLADFGIAKVLNDPMQPNQSILTIAGMMIGTPEYFSPEQARGSSIDQRSDVYSLGVVLFQMLTGRVPFSGNTPMVVAVKHTLEDPPSLTDINTAIPPEIEAVVRKSLAKQPDQRYASAGELARALRNAAFGAGESTFQSVDTPMKAATDNMMPVALVDTAKATETPSMPITPSPDLMAPSEREERTNAPTIVDGLPMPSSAKDLSINAFSVPGSIPEAMTSPEKTEFADAPTFISTRIPISGPNTPNPSIQTPKQPRSRSRLPWWVTAVSGVLIVLLIIGGLAFALHWLPSGGSTLPTSQQMTTTPQPTATQVPTTAATATSAATATATLPSPSVPTGTLLFGSILPICDQYNSLWAQPAASAANLHKTCDTTDTRLTNMGNVVHGVYLKSFAQGVALPNDYVIEVQVREVSQSNTAFGLFFRMQGPSDQAGYSFLIQPSGIWNGYEYAGGQSTHLAPNNGVGQGVPLNANGFTTIDIKVQGNTSTLYYNGAQQGAMQSGNYTSGIVGIAVDAGADVLFKNFAVYAIA